MRNHFRTLSVIWLMTLQVFAVESVLGAEAAFPSKPVKWVVPAPAGGPMDYVARSIAQKLSVMWGQQVIVENRAGGGGIIAAQAVMQASSDGYTLLHAHNGMMAINPHLFKSLPYDPLKSFAPVSFVGSGYAIVLVNPEVPAKNLQELIGLAKAKPGTLAFGSAGVGTPPHLTGAMFMHLTNTQLLHVPYKGSSQTITDLISGQIQIGFDYIVPAGEQVRAGKLRALAIAGPQRSPFLPDVPTAEEAGLKGFESRAWTALFAPVGTPSAVVNKISEDVSKILASAEEQANAAKLGFEYRGSTPGALRDYVTSELRRWGEAVRVSGAKVE